MPYPTIRVEWVCMTSERTDGRFSSVRRRLQSPATAAAGRWVMRVGLALLGIAAMWSLFPVHVTAAGVVFSVQATLLHRTALSADTTFGSWTFPHVDLLPVGVHLSPVNVDLVHLAATVSGDPARFAHRLRADLIHQAPGVAVRLGVEAAIGVAAGLLLTGAIGLAVRQLRGQVRPVGLWRSAAQQTMVLVMAVTLVGDIGIATFNREWTRESELSGTLAALQLFPGRLQSFYSQHSKALNALSAVAAIQAGLQRRIDVRDLPKTAYRIMFISDMHLASTYPLVRQYVRNFHVQLIINTGDEAEFGTKAEMTSSYLAQLRSVTKLAPMIWLAGNHDSPTTVSILRSVPGVTVVGDKTVGSNGQYAVTGGELDAYGLQVAAVPDPRVYGASPPDGASDDATVTPLEQHTIDQAVAGVPATTRFDIFASHEPVATDRALNDLPGQIRETAAGHLHAQNSDGDLQSGDGPITLVEGSTGAGGLDNLAGQNPAPPLEFSIESVATDCQFSKIVRFQIIGAAPSSAGAIGATSLPQVSVSTHYFTPQQIPATRQCSVSDGLGPVVPLP